MAPLAGVRFDAIAWKWKLVRLLRTAPQTAMPTAPPRLRIILNKPLAYLSRSGGRLPRPRLTLGATANTCGKPRKICGRKSSAAPHSWVMKLKLHIERPNDASPIIMSQRVSNRFASMT